MDSNYREAERLVDRADALLETAAADHGEKAAEAGFYMAMARAQVHATLALADVVAEIRDALVYPARTVSADDVMTTPSGAYYKVAAPSGAPIPVSPASAPEHGERH